jgi:uncharacterized membrane protein
MTNEAIKAAIAAVMAIVIVKLLGLISRLIRWATTSVKYMQNQKVPASIPKTLDHVIVVTALIWMLQRTVALSAPHPDGWSVALIATWTWALLTYALHIVRSK